MADEVIIIEARKPSGKNINGERMPIFGVIEATQVLDIATQSAALNTDTEMVRIQSNGTAFWAKVGDSSVSAAANTDGNIFVPADGFIDIEAYFTHIDTAADA